ncbi:hypothetical protein [Dongshaea marina]|uniref:hypothetical protein n=1 Tax=Dongshaea marina TaxID=2047966 RepID=UPI000D3ECB47|nr:hypothetical protein [Dongshaea marina]
MRKLIFRLCQLKIVIWLAALATSFMFLHDAYSVFASVPNHEMVAFEPVRYAYDVGFVLLIVAVSLMLSSLIDAVIKYLDLLCHNRQ